MYIVHRVTNNPQHCAGAATPAGVLGEGGEQGRISGCGECVTRHKVRTQFFKGKVSARG